MAKIVINLNHIEAVIPQLIIASIVLIVLLFVMSRFNPKIANITRNVNPYFEWLYIITVCISTWAMVFILITNRSDEYLLIPHFGDIINNILAYILTIVYPMVLLSLIYLWKKDLWLYFTTVGLTILLVPFISKLSAFPQSAYPNIILVILYIILIVILDTIIFKFLHKSFLMHLSFYGSLVVYFSLTGIVAGNLYIFLV